MRAFLLLVLLVSGPLAAAADSSSRQVSFGLMVAQKGLWQEARFRFERALALNPKNAAALNDLAVALEQMGEFEKARECYEKALALEPGDMYIQQNFDLFREADDKRNRKSRRKKPPSEGPSQLSGDKPPSEGPSQPPGDTPHPPPFEGPDPLPGDRPPSEVPNGLPESR